MNPASRQVVDCGDAQALFSEYLDGRLTGVEMQSIAAHLEECILCTDEFHALRDNQSALSHLAPPKAPEDLALRLRVTLSNEQARTAKRGLSRWIVRWQNSIQPLVFQASAGLASTLALIGTVTLMIGMVARPQPLAAEDEPVGMATAPHFLYSQSPYGGKAIGGVENPLVVEAYISPHGRVYDYRILNGKADIKSRAELENQLLFSVYEPARVFGAPVRGVVLLSFAGISVRG